MITIQLWENPLYDGRNPKWMASVLSEKGQHIYSGDTQIQAIEGALGMMPKLSPPG